MDLVISDSNIIWWNCQLFTTKIMKNKILPFSIIIIFGIIFLIFYKGLEESNIYTPNINVKNQIPVFNTKEFFSGASVESSNIFEIDKIYLLNIWASWCIPCRQEHSLLMNLNSETDINIIGINYKDNLKNAKNFLNELGNPYKEIYLDTDGTIAIELGAYGVPESFLIYKNKIIKKHIGPLNEKIIEEIKKKQ